MTVKTRLLVGALLSSAVMISSSVYAEVAIVVNKDRTEDSISLQDTKRIFLGKMSSLPSGGRTIAVDQAEGTGARAGFSEKGLGKSESQLKSYWSKKIFSGKGAPPPVMGSDVEIKTWLAENPEGLGYIDSGTVDSSVKVLLLVK